MQAKTQLQREKAHYLKAYQSAIRLKYSLMADDEIMRVMPEVEEKIDNALAMGKPLELSPGRAFDEV
jgi:hypothetical protein